MIGLLLGRLKLYGLIAAALAFLGLVVALKVESLRLAAAKGAQAQLRADNQTLHGNLARANAALVDQTKAVQELQQQGLLLQARVDGSRQAQAATAAAVEARIKVLLAQPAPQDAAGALSWAQAQAAAEARREGF